MPWTILAGIGTVESNNGQTTLPGVRSGQNGFGAAGPMQIGIEGASGNTWGGAPIHPASQVVAGVATDEDGNGTANVYDPPDAIAGAAKYLLEFNVQSNPSAAIFAYNHLQSYVQSVLMYAGQYAGGKFSVASAQLPAANTAAGCVQTAGGVPAVQAPTQAVATAISFAEQQLGKPYLWGGTGPDAFDCSGLMMMAYRTAGISIARTSQTQWATETRVPASQVQPGDLVFFAGADGTVTDPGHVGLVIGEREDDRGVRDRFPDPRLQLRQPRRDRLHRTLGRRQGHQPSLSRRHGQYDHPGRPRDTSGRRHAHPGQRRHPVHTRFSLTGGCARPLAGARSPRQHVRPKGRQRQGLSTPGDPRTPGTLGASGGAGASYRTAR